MGLFDRKAKPVELPPVLTAQENPVNYNSVLDYLVGLSPEEFKKMTKSAEIYRKADKEVAELVGVENTPTTTIVSSKPTDEEIDEGLDQALAGDFIAEDEPEPLKPTKKQAPAKKIEVSE